jgi:hypothetical protein
MQEASMSLEEAMRAAAGEAALRTASQRMQDVRAAMSQQSDGTPPSEQSITGEPSSSAYQLGEVTGEVLPIDATLRRTGVLGEGGSQGVSARTPSGGVATTELSLGQSHTDAAASENVFVPGKPGEGPSDSDPIQQPFTIRGAPRPYRDVIGQYAQDGRDYVDRAAVPSAVRELVRQYFAELEGQ